MAIVAQSPLMDLIVSVPISISIGDGVGGMTWDIPPGSLLPPGLNLNPSTGELYGVPTIPGTYSFYIRETDDATKGSVQREFLVIILSGQGVSEVTVQNLITQAFGLGKAYPGQKVWVEERIDAFGRKIFALKVDDNGQERDVASITIA